MGNGTYGIAWKRNKVVDAARSWWEGRRPVKWTEERHLLSPTVNCSTDSEAALANAVAAMLTTR